MEKELFKKLSEIKQEIKNLNAELLPIQTKEDLIRTNIQSSATKLNKVQEQISCFEQEGESLEAGYMNGFISEEKYNSLKKLYFDRDQLKKMIEVGNNELTKTCKNRFSVSAAISTQNAAAWEVIAKIECNKVLNQLDRSFIAIREKYFAACGGYPDATAFCWFLSELFADYIKNLESKYIDQVSSRLAEQYMK